MRPKFAAALFAMLLAVASHAQQQFDEGVHYVRLPVPSETPSDSIEVTEIFSYACPHCMSLEGPLNTWLSGVPSDVSFDRVPATFSEPYQMLAAVYYASEQLGVLEQMHGPIFEALHVRNLNVLRKDILERLFQDYADVDAEALDKAMNSFGVQTRVRQADALSRVFRITSVPALIVAGEYKVTPPPGFGGAAQLQIVEHLIEQVRATRDESTAE
ncbi:MAG: thiol:disulfide interchange protein DsbA/DsbL [Gammaproteobacteria bacterium]|nr:thiol:disulfide interchange protein DsbA/DsbL [Gammaproteobacteria bacterium]